MDYATRTGIELFALVFVIPVICVSLQAWVDERRKAKRLAKEMIKAVNEYGKEKV